MSIDSSVSNLLAGSATAFKFENIGDTCKGRVVRAVTQQQTDFDSGAPRFFPSGDPMMQLVVTVEQDDGEEASLYFRGGKFEVAEGKGLASLEALRAALAGAELQIGGVLAMQYSGNGKKNKGNPPKLYTVQYKAPAINIPDGESLI